MATRKSIERRKLKRILVGNLSAMHSHVISDAHVRVLSNIASTKVYRHPKRANVAQQGTQRYGDGVLTVVSAACPAQEFKDNRNRE